MEVNMERLFINIVQMSIPASYLILAVLIVRFLLRKAPKAMRSFLWLLVGIRLLVPFSVESVFSLIPDTQEVDAYINTAVQPEIDTVPDTPAMNANASLNQPMQSTDTPAAEKHMNRTQTAIRVGARIWLAGMALMLGYMVMSWLCLKKRVRMSVPAEVALDCGDTKISQKIYRSEAVENPFLFGIIKPRIYIPNRIAGEELSYVVRHEMTHLKRKDHLIKPAGFVLLSVYWFNPFVWAAYIMLCKDIELICDEKVVRQLGASCRKAYSQALLNSTVNRRAITACPVAFGGISVKERVKNVLNYKKPAFWVLAAAVLACIIVPVCFMTQKKTNAGETDDSASADAQDTEDYFLDDTLAMAGDYMMLDPEQYPLVPSLQLGSDGIFTFSYSVTSSYMPYGTYERKGNILTASTDDGKYHYQFTCAGDVNNSLLFFDAEHSSDVADINTRLNVDAQVRDGSIFVRNTLYQTIADAGELSQSFRQNTEQGTAMTAQELQDQLVSLTELQKQLTIGETQTQRLLEKARELQLTQEESAVLETTLQGWIQESRSVMQQLEEDLDTCKSMLHASENTRTAYDTIEQWAQAFCDRNGAAIVKLADDRTEQDLADRGLLIQGFDGEKDYVAFGWSSPWPWGSDYESAQAENYRIISVTDRYAEILYYAWVSNPHVTVWREQLTFKTENDTCVITSETLHDMDSICTAEEFRQAYPDGITGTMMDYVSFNGAGVALNDHAVSNREDWWYGKLLEPASAAVTLLNILDNPNKVGVRVEKTDTDSDTCTVTFEFHEDGNAVSVQMLQPYGPDGIWVPYTQTDQTVQESASSVSPNIITSQNVDDTIAEDARLLEALFPDHHESTPNVSFPYRVDLNGDGVEEQLEITNLGYNGGDGGYALTVTDTSTGNKIPLPDGYTEEAGFPIWTYYAHRIHPTEDDQQEEDARLLIQLGEEKRCQTIATIMLNPLYSIYERQNLYDGFKDVLPDHSGRIGSADALSGCNVFYYENEQNPVIVLKTYVSGFLGHVDTLGYVITELRLQEDDTWVSKHYFLLDGCGDMSVMQQEMKSPAGNGNSFLPFSEQTDVDFIQLAPEN